MNNDYWINRRDVLLELGRSGIDYDTREKVRRILEIAKTVDLSERDEGKEPILESRTSVYHVIRSDGTGGFKSSEYEDWMCPVCGWFVGELYSGFGRWHIQGETSYCARCGQRIDWTKPAAEEKRRYEERKAKEREEWERKNGHGLDNMHEHRRRKYGLIKDGEADDAY